MTFTEPRLTYHFHSKVEAVAAALSLRGFKTSWVIMPRCRPALQNELARNPGLGKWAITFQALRLADTSKAAAALRDAGGSKARQQ